jgi:hypothetical protein
MQNWQVWGMSAMACSSATFSNVRSISASLNSFLNKAFSLFSPAMSSRNFLVSIRSFLLYRLFEPPQNAGRTIVIHTVRRFQYTANTVCNDISQLLVRHSTDAVCVGGFLVFTTTSTEGIIFASIFVFTRHALTLLHTAVSANQPNTLHMRKLLRICL